MAKDGAIVVMWNPSKYEWSNLEKDVEQVSAGKKITLGWTVGRRREIAENTLVFCRRVGRAPLGFMGYGYTAGPVQTRRVRKKTAFNRKFFVDIEVRDLIDPGVDGVLDPIVFKGDKELLNFSKVQGNGSSISHEAAQRLRDHWLDWRLAVEADSNQGLGVLKTNSRGQSIKQAKEGDVERATRNHRRRERRLRSAKLEQVLTKNGCLQCEVCNDDLAEWYGESYADLIEVHHKKAISLRKTASKTTLMDLAVVCPTCHRFIHRHNPMLSIAKARKMMC